MKEGGGTLGPDLTSIQKDRSVHDIIEAIVYPSVSFVREYETYKVTTSSGELRGIIKEQTPDMLLLETAPETTVRVSMDDVTAIEQLEVSMMPQGLDQILSEQEFSDLMAYLLGKDLVY
jgi:putative heme-binding domain-containing protein